MIRRENRRKVMHWPCVWEGRAPTESALFTDDHRHCSRLPVYITHPLTIRAARANGVYEERHCCKLVFRMPQEQEVSQRETQTRIHTKKKRNKMPAEKLYEQRIMLYMRVLRPQLLSWVLWLTVLLFIYLFFVLFMVFTVAWKTNKQDSKTGRSR